MNAILHSQRTIGNQAVQRMLGVTVGDKPPSGPPKVEPKPDAKPKVEPKPDAPPKKAEPKPDAKPGAAPKPAAPTITSKTKFGAPDGSAKTRTDVGVGEVVTFTGSASGQWTATSGLPVKLASGQTFNWTAPDRATDVAIKLTVAGESATLGMKVLEPTDITGVRNSTLDFAPGKAGAGMRLTFNYNPKKVSFGNVEAEEVPGPATNITGYFKKHYTADFLKHKPTAGFTAIKATNEDTAKDEASMEVPFTPYENGTYDWVIPNKFRVHTEKGDGKEFTKVTQAFSIDAAGTMRVTKAGVSVERKVTDP